MLQLLHSDLNNQLIKGTKLIEFCSGNFFSLFSSFLCTFENSPSPWAVLVHLLVVYGLVLYSILSKSTFFPHVQPLQSLLSIRYPPVFVDT